MKNENNLHFHLFIYAKVQSRISYETDERPMSQQEYPLGWPWLPHRLECHATPGVLKHAIFYYSRFRKEEKKLRNIVNLGKEHQEINFAHKARQRANIKV